MPLLATFRTAKEGGEKEILKADYEKLNLAVINSGYADLIDVEAFIGEDTVKRLIVAAHQAGVKVVASNHDFTKTPPKEEIIKRLEHRRADALLHLGHELAVNAAQQQPREEAEQEAGENEDVAKVIQSRDDNIFHHISHPLKALSA